MSTDALQWQRQLYLSGFAGGQPLIPADFSKLEALAKNRMSKKAFAYVAGGAGRELTVQANVDAFARCSILPRVLRDVGTRDTSVTLFGKKYRSPFLLSPIGVLELAHKDADLAVAKAAARAECPFIFSNQASVAMEQCSYAMQESQRWFQLYWSKSRELVASFVRRAEACACQAIVVTLDTTMLGWRTRDLDLGYLPFLEGRGIAQYTTDPVFQTLIDKMESPSTKSQITLSSIAGLIKMVNRYPGDGFVTKLRSKRPIKAVQTFINLYSNPSITWNDLSYLRSLTQLPILLKGILHPLDARLALEHGVNGIIVSNHGGRQVDGAIPAFFALPAIVEEVKKRIPVLFDSGIRGGADAFKALAVGASAVCIGRPYVYGLALAGEAGVFNVIQNYLSEFELTMALSGCKNVSEISSECIRMQSVNPVC